MSKDLYNSAQAAAEAMRESERVQGLIKEEEYARESRANEMKKELNAIEKEKLRVKKEFNELYKKRR